MISKIKVILMRHGKSDNKDILTLTSEGRTKIAEQIKKLKKTEKIDYIITSPVLRAYETASVAADLLNIPISAIRIDPRLREPFFGEMEGKSYKDYEGEMGGESDATMGKRINNFLEEFTSIENYNGKTILLISHLFTIRKILELVNHEIQNLNPAEFVIFHL